MSNFGLTTPNVELKGEFNTSTPDIPIPTGLYGLLPQLTTFNTFGCVPASLTNAFAALAAKYNKPELLVSGVDKHDQLLNTFDKIAVDLKITSTGVTPNNIDPGIKNYFDTQGVSEFFSVNTHGPYEDLFVNLISEFAKGPVVFIGSYFGPGRVVGLNGAHALTAVELNIDDKNKNMRVDKGEAILTVIDPLDPAKEYFPDSINVNPPFDNQEREKLWERTIQASSKAQPKLKKVEIYQDSDGLLVFDYQQTAIGKVETPAEDPSKWTVSIGEGVRARGSIMGISGLQYSSLQDNIDELIAPSKENDVVFDFSSFIENGDVSGELFSYINEGSSLDNNLSFYQLADSSGTIIDPITRERLSPGDNGYIELAQKQSKIFEASDTSDSNADLDGRVSADQAQMGSFSFSLDSVDGTALFAPIVSTSAGDTWTTFGEANRDSEDHFKWMGGLSFQMEDEFGLGDRDFNDLQVVLTPLEINGVA